MISENNEPCSAVLVEVPQGWHWKESYTLIPEDAASNVIASSEPLDTSITTEQYAAAQGELLSKEFDEYQQYSLEPAVIEGVDTALLRDFAWTPPNGKRVRQLQLYAVVGQRGVTATATALDLGHEKLYDDLRRIVLSLVITPR